MARVFLDAQAKRNDADYDLNEFLSESDARLLLVRVRGVVAEWRAAVLVQERDAKRAMLLLMLMKGQLRKEN